MKTHIPILLAALPAALAAQQPARDSVRTDSARTQALPSVRVTVTAASQRLDAVPWAVGVVGQREIRRGQPTVNLDEALASIPGVYVANRYNYAVDSRIAIRGFGARANFGLRGVKVLLDGIPQTLPDGQSQITNIELGAIDRVEVLRGSTSSLHGNGSAGVLAFSTDLSSSTPLQQVARVTAGSFGLLKLQTRTSGRIGRATGALSLSRLTVDGARQWSAAEVRQLNGALDYAVSDVTTAQLRLNLADVPRAENPGALTRAEYAANRDSGAAANQLRRADKRTTQNQLSATLRRAPREGEEYQVSVYGTTRDVRNALAAAPPGSPATSNASLYATLDRAFYGVRASGVRPLGDGPRAATLTAGLDAQRMTDDRRNRRATAGRPTQATDTLLLNQIEDVASVGPFAQLAWPVRERLLLSAGARYDHVRFLAEDRFLGDGDNSANRAMPAWSGHLGLTFTESPRFAPYVNLSTSFETPTTTELQLRADGLGGFNPELGPQRTRSVELGARGALAVGRVSWNVAGYLARVSDAIVQFAELNGRAYFRNAGRSNNDGLELGASAAVAPGVSLNAAYTYSRFRFADYRQQRVVRGAVVVDTLDGNFVPGVPLHFLRTGLRTSLGRSLTLDMDHTWASRLVADDLNTITVPDWGRGVLSARVAGTMRLGGTRLEPFAGVQNAFDQGYVGAVTVNGFGGRVLEPAPLRNFFLGMEIGFGR